MDPLAGTMSGWSPYNYAYNNPIAFLDPLGLSPYKYNWTTEQYEDDSGNAVHWSTVNNYLQNGTTLDVHLVNDFERSGINVGDFGEIAVGAQRILARNGIEGNLNFHLESKESMQRLPTYFSYEDRALFLALTNNRYSTIGAASIHKERGTVSTWFSYEGKITIASGIDVSKHLMGDTGQMGLSSSNRSKGIYLLSYVIAHELAHELDAFSLMSSEGSLNNRGSEGHYNGINLLMDGREFKSQTMKPGGSHELLPAVVRARILEYLKK